MKKMLFKIKTKKDLSLNNLNKTAEKPPDFFMKVMKNVGYRNYQYLLVREKIGLFKFCKKKFLQYGLYQNLMEIILVRVNR